MFMSAGATPGWNRPAHQACNCACSASADGGPAVCATATSGTTKATQTARRRANATAVVLVDASTTLQPRCRRCHGNAAHDVVRYRGGLVQVPAWFGSRLDPGPA